MHGLTAIVPVALMLALLPLGTPGMGLAMSLGMGTVAAFAIRALARIARLPFRTILLQMRPAAAAGASMVVGVYLLDRLLVHAEQSRGLLGVGLLSVDVVAAAAIYLGSLLLVSRRSAVELKELGELVLRRIDPAS
jgi:hypothetical protein